MKSISSIEQRLRTLRIRYTKKYIFTSQERLHYNCVYNHEHTPTNYQTEAPNITHNGLSPKSSITLVVVQPNSPIRICLYGADNPAKWPGNICDSSDISKKCPWFQPKMTLEEAKNEFANKIANDDFVLENYPDVAALQWVLSDRLHKKKLSFFEKISLWFFTRFFKKPQRELPSPESELPTDFWNDQ